MFETEFPLDLSDIYDEVDLSAYDEYRYINELESNEYEI